MKRKQAAAVLLSIILAVSACVPMSGIGAFAAESAGSSEAAVEEKQSAVVPASESSEAANSEEAAETDEDAVAVETADKIDTADTAATGDDAINTDAIDDSAIDDSTINSATTDDNTTDDNAPKESTPDDSEAQDSAQEASDAEISEATETTSEATTEEATEATNAAATEEATEAATESTTKVATKAATLTGINLNRHTLTIKIGDTAQLEASAIPETAAHGNFIWETGDNDIATVDQSGQVTAVGIGTTTIYVCSENYEYYDSCELKVTKINLSGASVLRISGNRPYTGGKIQPSPVVKLDGVTLQEGRDYKVNYSRNTNVGTATCIVTGQNNYSGSVKRTFEIVKAPNRFVKIATGGITLPLSLMSSGTLGITLNSKAKFDAKMTYELLSVPAKIKKYIALSSGGKLSIKKGITAGTYKIKIRVTAAETKNSKKASGTKEIKIVLKSHMKQYSSLTALGVNGYSKEVDRKVNAAFDEMIVKLNGQSIKYANLSDYQKAYVITLHIGTKYYYKDGSYNAESMLDKGYGTCFAYSDLTYLMAKKAGLSNSWLTVPGRNVDHGGKFYGSQHRSVVTKIGKDYYELDSNGVASMLQFLAAGYPVDLTPEKISESYARYLIGKAKTFTTIN